MKRDTSLDIIRIAAIWLIVTFHFCAELGLTDSPFCTYKNGGWGSVGTTMFFVLSGYVMRLCHKQIPKLRTYYKKRFLAIYPMFWISFAAAYVILSVQLADFRYGGSPWRMIYSILGIDNYLGFYQISTYAVVGEWFTAVIVVIYILYPLFNRIFERWMIPATIVLAVLYLANIAADRFIVPPDANVITGIFMFWIGMILEKYGTKIKEQRLLVLPALTVALVVVFVKLPLFVLPWKNLLGISIFIILFIICQNLGNIAFIAKPARFLSEISYGVYLCHHFILKEMAGRYGSLLVSGKRILFFYGSMFCIVIITAVALYYITSILIKK